MINAMITSSPILLGSPGQDISKKDLSKVTQRFTNLHQTRLKQVQSYLQPRQRIFLSLLPLLFHQNHPLLPGFISSETIAGIPNYRPNNNTILHAKSFSKHFSYKRRALRQYPIHGIYLMGSVSSVAFTKNSDIDIWLCHEHDLPEEDLNELQSKATAIEQWAESLGLEAHFFLINSKEFIQGITTPLSSESSGQTQHYLLLEEFYRTALFIAGRTPLWWLVPPHEEHNYNNYVNHLKEKRFISNHDVIDFGSLEKIPAEEFVSATLWHLYKSLSSPYKSLLKLLLMESYASEYPEPQWLALDVKTAVYNGNFTLEDIDPYALIYHKLEKYLKNDKSSDRLNFVRQCFYLKISGALEKNSSTQSKPERDELIDNLVKQYKWPSQIITNINNKQVWGIDKASHENDIIIHQLKLCYQIISRFSNTNAYSIKQQDIQLIGRKLKSFLQKKPGKVDIITTRSSIHSKETELSLIEASSPAMVPSWNLFPGNVNEVNSKKIKAFKQDTRSFIELLSWLIINGLYQQRLNLHIHSKLLSFNKSDIHNILNTLHTFLLEHKLGNLSPLSAFKEPNRIIANLLLLNLGHTQETSRKDGMVVISKQSDIFSYGPEQVNFIHTIEQVSVSSWGEVTTKKFEGLEGLFNCFVSIINLHAQPSSIKIECYTAIRGKSIALGVEQLSQKLYDLFLNKNTAHSPRLIVSGEQDFYIFQRKDSCLHFWKINTLESLLIELARPQINFSSAHFNGATLNNTPIPLLYSFAKENTILVFFITRNQTVNLYIIDEKGSLFSHRYTNTSTKQLLTAYSNFINTLNDKGVLNSTLSTRYFDLHLSGSGQYSATEIFEPTVSTWDYLNIRIAGEIYSSSSEILYTLYCNELEFSTETTDDNIFKTVAEYIIDIRQGHAKYPIHITEIDVPLQALGVDNYQQLQTSHFLRYKHKIESRINTYT